MSFFVEIRRRKVFQVAAVYAVVAWLLIQIVGAISDPLSLPDWLDAVVIVLLAVGFPIALILAWAFDFAPRGLEPDPDVRRADVPSRLPGQTLTFMIQGLVLLAVGFLVVDQYLLGPRVASDPGSSATAETESRPINRFEYLAPRGQELREQNRPVLALSPNGRHFAYNTTGGLYLRRMSQLEGRVIPGTEEELGYPVFSPDGESIAYWSARGQLIRIAISGEMRAVIADNIADLSGLSWSEDGTIFLALYEAIYQVPAAGGELKPIVTAEAGTRLSSPVLLPDDDSVLFTIESRDTSVVAAQSLSTGQRTTLIEGGGDARYLPTGHLVYVIDDSLVGIAFDLENLTTVGRPVPLLRGISRAETNSIHANYAVSNDGTLVYVSNDARPASTRSLIWVDRQGVEQPITAESGIYLNLSISPDGEQAVLDERNAANDLWIWDFGGGTRRRLQLGDAGGDSPVWTPTTMRIAYHPRVGDAIHWRRSDNIGTREVLAGELTKYGGGPHPYFFASETELVFGGQASPNSGLDIGRIVLDSEAEPEWLVRGQANERRADLSYDRRYMAYQSDETGRSQIYVRTYPNVEEKGNIVSDSGGETPRWSPSSNELFYIEMGPPTRLMSVVIEETDTTLRVVRREPILDWPYLQDLGQYGRPYDVSSNGQRFLALKADRSEMTALSIVVVDNWFEELTQFVPTE